MKKTIILLILFFNQINCDNKKVAIPALIKSRMERRSRYKYVPKFPGCPNILYEETRCYKDGETCSEGEICCLGEEKEGSREGICPNLKCLKPEDCPSYLRLKECLKNRNCRLKHQEAKTEAKHIY